MNTDWHRQILVDGLTPEQVATELHKISPKEFQKVELECVIHRDLYKTFVCGSCEDKENVCFMCFVVKHNGHALNLIPSVDTSTSSSSSSSSSVYNLRSSKKDLKKVKSFSCVLLSFDQRF
jgi:hypothetical protein